MLFSCVHDHRHCCHWFSFVFFFGFFWAPMLAMSQRSSALAQSVSRGDGMGFTDCSLVSTIMLSVRLLQPVYLSIDFVIFSVSH